MFSTHTQSEREREREKLGHVQLSLSAEELMQVSYVDLKPDLK